MPSVLCNEVGLTQCFSNLLNHPRLITRRTPSAWICLLFGWALVLTLGTALVIHPKLGSSVTANNGSTPTNFIAAMYAAGSSIAITERKPSWLLPDTKTEHQTS